MTNSEKQLRLSQVASEWIDDKFQQSDYDAFSDFVRKLARSYIIAADHIGDCFYDTKFWAEDEPFDGYELEAEIVQQVAQEYEDRFVGQPASKKYGTLTDLANAYLDSAFEASGFDDRDEFLRDLYDGMEYDITGIFPAITYLGTMGFVGLDRWVEGVEIVDDEYSDELRVVLARVLVNLINDVVTDED